MDRVGEGTKDEPGVSFESGREPGLNTFFQGVPCVVVPEVAERVLVAAERREAAEE